MNDKNPNQEFDASKLAASILKDAQDRLDHATDRAIHEEDYSDEVLRIGQPSAWASGLEPSHKIAVMHPDVAEAMRARDGWARTLVNYVRFTNWHSGETDTLRGRRRRLRRTLNALNAAFELHPDLATLDVRDDLALLGLALDGLDVGATHPLLRTPEGVGNRPPDHKLTQQFRVYIIAFAVILDRCGVTGQVAYEWIANELDRAGVPQPKGAKRDTPGHKWKTIAKWHKEGMPGYADGRTAPSDPLRAPAKKLPDDAHQVARLITSFVGHALAERQSMPPTLEYAQAVIRQTMREPSFHSLVA